MPEIFDAETSVFATRQYLLPTLVVAMTLLRVALQETQLVADAGADLKPLLKP